MSSKFSNFDLRIDFYLKELSEQGQIEITESAYTKQDSDDKRFNISVRRRMTEELNLAMKIGSTLILTEKGRAISGKGGWLHFLNEQEKLASRSERKDKWDYLYSKFRYFTYWWIFSFSLIGSFLGLYNFLNSISGKEEQLRTETSIQEEEVNKSEQENPPTEVLHTIPVLATEKELDSSDTAFKKDSIPRLSPKQD